MELLKEEIEENEDTPMISKFNIIDLPDVIYTIIQSYISNYDYRCFMNTSKAGFALIKRKTIYSSLYIHASKYYCIDREYREDILQTVLHPERQISIYFKHYHEIKEALEEEIMTSPSSSQERSEENDNNENNDEIPITQSQSSSSTSTSENEITLADNGAASSSSQHSLEISHCPGLKDLTNFSFIHRLVIVACPGIINLHALKDIYDLTLDLCWERHSLTCLTSHHYRLKLMNLSENTSGYEILYQIPHVSLETSFIHDLQVLSEARSISLERCYKVNDVSPLINVKEICLKECSKITNIRSLQGIERLTIGYLPSLASYEGLGNHIH
eukprot:gene11210-12216_t